MSHTRHRRRPFDQGDSDKPYTYYGIIIKQTYWLAYITAFWLDTKQTIQYAKSYGL